MSSRRSHSRATTGSTSRYGPAGTVVGQSLLDDGLVIDVRPMNAIEVDPDRRVARVGGGALWSEVDRATQEHGLATTGGRVSTTGVGGLTLGGGSGWLERKHGLTVDNLLSAELVTADGRIVRASDDENPDLFWALRGGGGNFGVVTRFEFRLHPLGPEVFAGLVLHRPERGALLRLWRDVMREAPDELSLAFGYLGAPDEPEIPEHLRGKPAAAVAGMYAGPIAEGEEALRAIRFGPPDADFFGAMPYTEMQSSIDDPPGMRNYWTAEYVADLPDETLDRIATRGEDKPIPFGQVFVAWGGAVPRVPEGDTAHRPRRQVHHPPAGPLGGPRRRRGGDRVGPRLPRRRRRRRHRPHLHQLRRRGWRRPVKAAFGPNRERLARIKAEWDPENVFRATGYVPPSSPD